MAPGRSRAMLRPRRPGQFVHDDAVAARLVTEVLTCWKSKPRKARPMSQPHQDGNEVNACRHCWHSGPATQRMVCWPTHPAKDGPLRSAKSRKSETGELDHSFLHCVHFSYNDGRWRCVSVLSLYASLIRDQRARAGTARAAPSDCLHLDGTDGSPLLEGWGGKGGNSRTAGRQGMHRVAPG